MSSCSSALISSCSFRLIASVMIGEHGQRPGLGHYTPGPGPLAFGERGLKWRRRDREDADALKGLSRCSAFCEDQGDVVVLLCGIQAADFAGDCLQRGL